MSDTQRYPEEESNLYAGAHTHDDAAEPGDEIDFVCSPQALGDGEINLESSPVVIVGNQKAINKRLTSDSTAQIRIAASVVFGMKLKYGVNKVSANRAMIAL